MTLREQINIDLIIDKSKLDDEAINHPALVQKYLNLYFDQLRRLHPLQHEYDLLYKDKLIFYTTKFDLIPKTVKELDSLIKGDLEIIELQKKIDEQNILISFLKESVDNIKNKGWAIKNAIDMMKFKEGMG